MSRGGFPVRRSASRSSGARSARSCTQSWVNGRAFRRRRRELDVTEPSAGVRGEHTLMSAEPQPAAIVGSQTVRLSIPAKAEYITLVRLALSGLSHLRPLSEEALGDLKLAVTEACTNSVRHGYAGGEGTVDIVYEL